MGKQARVLVTGGGTGIGYACAQAFLERGCRVGIVGRRTAVLDDAVRQLSASAAGRVVALPADLGEPHEPSRVVADFVAMTGGIDVLVNGAASCSPLPTLELTAESWDAIAGPALRGAALASVAAARVMRAAGEGRIVMITSIDAEVSEPNVAHYCAAKAGLAAFARSLAVDLGAAGVRVNSVAPGWVRTATASSRLDRSTPESLARLNPLARAAAPVEIAETVTWVALDAPDFLTGSTITVDGAQTVMAGMP